MTDCKDIREKLSLLVDGMLAPEEEEELRTHLSSCRSCMVVFEDLRKTVEHLNDLPAVEPPPWFKQKVMAEIYRGEREKKSSLLHRLLYPLSIKIPLQVVATLVIVVIALYIYRTVEPETGTVYIPPLSSREVVQSVEQPRPVAPAVPYRKNRQEPASPGHVPLKTEGTAKAMEPERPRPQAPAPAPLPSARTLAPGSGKAMKDQDMADSIPGNALPEGPPKVGGSAKEKKTSPSSVDTLKAPQREKAFSPLPPSVSQEAYQREDPTKTITVRIAVTNPEDAAETVIDILASCAAMSISRSRHGTGILITARVPGSRFAELIQRLHAAGTIVLRQFPKDPPGEINNIRIELIAR